MPLLEKPKRSNESRWYLLNDVSKILSGFGTSSSKDEQKPTKMEIFTLSKALSIEDAVSIPHPRDEKGQYDNFTRHITDIAQEKHCDKPLEFYSPLLVKYAFSLSEPVVDSTVAWFMLKKRLSSFGPPGWTEGQKKLDSNAMGGNIQDDASYPLPEFIQRASESLRLTCEADRLSVHKLHEMTIKSYPKRAQEFRDTAMKRRENTFQMNRWASVMALGYLLWKFVNVEGSEGREAATDFSLAIADVDELERYCQVLDVEEATYRIVEMSTKEGVPVHELEYILDDTERELPEDQSASEDEISWWHWVENVLKELIRRGQECDEDMFDRISRFLLRIDRNGTDTEAVRLTLRDWHNKDRE